jgi:hypothetical protein
LTRETAANKDRSRSKHVNNPGFIVKTSNYLTVIVSTWLTAFGASGAVFFNGDFDALATPGLGSTYDASPGAPAAFGWVLASLAT